MGRGGAQAPDNKPRVSGPGPFSRRADMDGSQPIRAPGGQDYGERGELEAQQAAAPVPEGGPLGEGAASAVSSDNVAALLGSVGTQRPSEDVMVGAGGAPSSPPLASPELVEGVEYLMQSMEAPSQALVDLYLTLRKQEIAE